MEELEFPEIMLFKVVYGTLINKIVGNNQETINVWLAAGWSVSSDDAWEHWSSLYDDEL